jgi:hypothetical protein
MAERRLIAGPVFGVLVFLFGVALILLTFGWAYKMYQTPPLMALNVEPDKPINLNNAASALMQALFQVILLIVMAAIGSIIAGRGIKMYSATARPEDRPRERPKKDLPKPPAPEPAE